MKEELGGECGERVRFLLDDQSFIDYSNLGISTANRVRIEEGAERLSRSALKLARTGILQEPDAAAIIELENRVKLEVEHQLAEERARAASEPTSYLVSRLPTRAATFRLTPPQLAASSTNSDAAASASKNETWQEATEALINRIPKGQSNGYKAFVFGIVDRLPPANDSYWSQVDPQTVGNYLLTLQDRLFDIAMTHKINTATKTAGALLKLAAIAVRISPEEMGRFYARRLRHHLDNEDGCRYRPNSGRRMGEYTSSASAIRALADSELTDLDAYKQDIITSYHKLEDKTIKTRDDFDDELLYLDNAALAYFKANEQRLEYDNTLKTRLDTIIKSPDFPDRSSLARLTYWSFIIVTKYIRRDSTSPPYLHIFLFGNEIHKSISLSGKLIDPSNPGRGYGWDSRCKTHGKLRTFITTLLQRREVVELSERDPLPRTTQNQQLAHRYTVPTESATPPLNECEVQSLFSTLISDHLLIPQVVDYFTQHFERLNERPFCALLESLLFTKENHGDGFVLIRLGREHQRMKHQLWEFLSNAIRQTRTLGWTEASLSLLRIQIQVYDAWSNYDIEIEEGENHLAEEMTIFLQDQNPERRPMICHWITSTFQYTYKNNHLGEICRTAYTEILNFNLTYSWEGMLEKEEDYLLAGIYFSLNTPQMGVETFLPIKIVNKAAFRELYNRNFVAKMIAPDLWEFVDDRGRRTRVSTENSKLVLHREFLDSEGIPRFFEFASPSNLASNINNWVLSRNHQYWRGIEGKDQALITTFSGVIRYRIIGEHLYCWDGSHVPLRLSVAYRAPLLQYLFRVAPSGEWLPWMNENEVTEIELPRFSLSFVVDDHNHWQCTATPGYYLDERSSISELDPYSHYLVLRNQKGERQLLMPDLPLKQAQKTLALPPPELSETTGQRLFHYRIEKSGAIEPPFDPAASLYLAYLAMERGDYAKSYQIIDRLEQEPQEWDAEALRILNYFPHHKNDKHPRACAIRLKLAFMASR
jgi:hypothetical protein